MEIHKLVQGGERWLPFALAKLRLLFSLTKNGGKFLSQVFSMPDGAVVRVRVTGDHQFVHITGGGEYEFFTSEHIHPVYHASPGYYGTPGSFIADDGRRVAGSLSRASAIGVTPVYSHVFDPLEPTDWRKGIATEPIDTANIGQKGYPKSWGAWQNAKAFEYITWLGHGAVQVSSTQAQAPGLGSQCGFLSAYFRPRLSNIGAFTSDYGADVPPTLYTRGKTFAGAPQYESPWIFWRHGAVQAAGGRWFFICTDSIGRFQVYSAKEYQAAGSGVDYRALPPGAFNQYTPPYPAWVTVPNPLNPNEIHTRHWLWQFNKDATRAVSCPFHSEYSAEFLTRTILPNPSVLTPASVAAGYADAVTREDAAAMEYYDSTQWVPTREDWPGLVEFGIEITVFGPGDLDFSVEFTLLRNLYSRDAGGRYVFDAAYTLPDRGKNKLMGVVEDTLVFSEVQCSTTPGGYSVGPLNLPAVPSAGLVNPSPEVKQVALFVDAFLVIAAMGATVDVASELRRFPLETQSARSRGHNSLTALGLVQRGQPEYAGWPQNTTLWDSELQPVTMYNEALELGTAPIGTAYSFIAALELRTLSLIAYVTDLKTGLFQARNFVYNDPYLSAPEVSIGAPAPGYYPVCSERIPASADLIHARMLQFCINTEWSSGFSIHPKGHWSCSLPDGPANANMDIVHFANGRQTTHQALFNKAFGQSRTPAFYAEDYPERPGSLPRDLGSFRSNGVWIDY